MYIRQADFSENLCAWPYGGMLFLFEHFVAAEMKWKVLDIYLIVA